MTDTTYIFFTETVEPQAVISTVPEASADSLGTASDTLGAVSDTIPASDSILAATDTLAAADSLLVEPIDTIPAIDTILIEPIDSAFTAGTLIPAEPTHAGEQFAYTNSLLLHILAVVSVVLVLSVLRRLARVLPSLFGCLLRWKEALHLEFSSKLSRDRDAVFAAFILPACLELDRYDVLFRSATTNLDPELHLLIVVTCFLCYLGLRILMRNLCKGKKMNASTYSTTDALFRTYFCLYVIICLIASGLLSVIGLPANLINAVLFYESVFLFCLFLLRKGQILFRACSLLSTILYLCGHEILPAAIVIAPAVIL